ncbi:MAG: hypothetical protein P4L03_08605 [Terracidiphilus sp.]|nr:hypothetical protein [Terracidiphilus sp.]
MKKLLAAVLLCAFALPASAVRKVTVAELDRILADKHKPSDSLLADILTDVELTERCSAACLARFESLYPGKMTHDALVSLAGSSAFLSLPASELPPDPAPSMEEQRRIVKLAVGYVVKTLPQLPNFLAERQTVNYESPLPETRAASYLRFTTTPADARPTRVVARSVTYVAYRDGHEILDPSLPPKRSFREKLLAPSASGALHRLTSNGEFGPILNLIVYDAPKGSIVWSHWERNSAGLEAHFSFTVFPANSHFHVDFPCGSSDTAHYPAYHGEFAVDPATGAILRLALSGTLADPCPPVSSSIVTEYGPVQIGGRTYICPLHSVSISLIPPLGPNAAKAELNDVLFTGYHLFRAETRILPASDSQP